MNTDKVEIIAEGPSGLVGQQNPFKSVEQVLEPASPAKTECPKDRNANSSGMTEGPEPGSIFLNDGGAYC